MVGSAALAIDVSSDARPTAVVTAATAHSLRRTGRPSSGMSSVMAA